MIIQKLIPEISDKKSIKCEVSQINKPNSQHQNYVAIITGRNSSVNKLGHLEMSQSQFNVPDCELSAFDDSTDSSNSEVYSPSQSSSSDEEVTDHIVAKDQVEREGGIKLEAHIGPVFQQQSQASPVSVFADRRHTYQTQQYRCNSISNNTNRVITTSNMNHHNNNKVKPEPVKLHRQSIRMNHSSSEDNTSESDDISHSFHGSDTSRRKCQRKRKRPYVARDCKHPTTADLLSHLRAIDDNEPIRGIECDDFDITMTGEEIIDKLCDRRSKTEDLRNLSYLPGNKTPEPPKPPPLVETVRNPSRYRTFKYSSEYYRLLPQTPSVFVDNCKDAHSKELRQFCLSQPVAIIRNLAATLRLDLGLFSSKMLVESNPTHKIEQRIQDLQAPDENKDPTGKTVFRCHSSKSITTIQEYANYQARTFVEATRYNEARINGSATSIPVDETAQCAAVEDVKMNIINEDKKKKRKIYFGTNCDLSDNSKWYIQLQELNKLPDFLKVVSPLNLLSHCGFTIMGMNSVQLYMKVPGCRTPGHQENNNFCSININIGPGDCEWFSVTEQYWGAINSICDEHKVDYLSGSWWPNLDDLRQRHIPVYRFIQRPGDLVWINAGTVHWVQAIGWCNNVAWNVGPLVSRQYSLAMERYEYNKVTMYKSIVPMIHLSWRLAQHVPIDDRHLHQLIKYTLMVSIIQCTLTWKFLEKANISVVYQPREEKELTQYCEDCETEVFNIFLIKPSRSGISTKKSSKYATYETRCLQCALKINPNLNSFKSLYQYKLSELAAIYDSFQFQE